MIHHIKEMDKLSLIVSGDCRLTITECKIYSSKPVHFMKVDDKLYVENLVDLTDKKTVRDYEYVPLGKINYIRSNADLEIYPGMLDDNLLIEMISNAKLMMYQNNFNDLKITLFDDAFADCDKITTKNLSVFMHSSCTVNAGVVTETGKLYVYKNGKIKCRAYRAASVDRKIYGFGTIDLKRIAPSLCGKWYG